MPPTVPPPIDKVDPARAWQPWEPGAKDPFNLKWAGHLFRRAGFGASLSRPAHRRREGTRRHPDAHPRRRRGGRGARASAGRRRRQDGERRQAGRAARLVGLLHGPHRPAAAREDDAVLAQPLRHQHRQGRAGRR